MNKPEYHKKVIQRFKTCINTCDYDLAEELIDSRAEFASLTSSETLYGGKGYLSVVEFMGRKPSGKKFAFSCMNFYYFNEDGKIIRDVAAQGLAGLIGALDA